MNPMNMNGGNMPNGVPGNMAAMNNAANAGTPRAQPDSDTSEYKAKLNTYIYDYLLKNEQYDCARLLLNSSLNVLTKPAGAKKRNDDSMDTDSKDDIDLKKLGDLPLPDRILDANTENSFLLDWFTLFWEIFFAPRVQKPSKANPAALQYTNHIRDQSKARVEAQNNFLRQPGMANMQQYNVMRMQQGMAPQNMNDLRNRLNAQNPQLAARHQQQQQMLQQRMIQQQQMERAGSEAEMNGQRPRTPSSAAMMQGMEGMPEFYANGPMRQGMPQNTNGAGGNHALQDYQMQLMLLEQQNKKRLLMARQEQDNLRPDQQGNMPGQPFPGPGPQGQPGMMNAQQAQQMQQQMQQQAQQGQPGPQPGQPAQPPQNPQAQAQMGTPQQRNAAMPPPQNVPAGGAAAAANGRPASPAASAASTTPQQANKANPKKKDTKEPRKRPNKKGAAAAATPSAEGDAPPPTPTPQTPITPMNKGFNEQAKNGQQTQNAPAQANAAAGNQGTTQAPPEQGMMPQFEGMEGQMDDVNIDFGGLDTSEVLTNFDFDAFLQDDGTAQDFDISGFGNYDGLEADAS